MSSPITDHARAPGSARAGREAPVFDAVVLAGGRASRLGGLDKPALDVGGATLLERAVLAVRAARRVVVVGPYRPEALPRPVRWAREDPAFGGPMAALAAGLARLPGSDAPLVLLAADLPYVTAHTVARLVESLAIRPGDGAVVLDDTGDPQPLLAVYRRPGLDSALHAVGGAAGRPVRLLLDLLACRAVRDPVAAVDVDTSDDLAAVLDAATSSATGAVDGERAAARP